MPTNSTRIVHPAFERIASAIPEQRRELGLSVRTLAQVAGVSRWSLTRIEHGERVNPALLLHVADVLTTIELYTTPAKPTLEPEPVQELPLLLRPARRLLHRSKPLVLEVERNGDLFGGAA